MQFPDAPAAFLVQRARQRNLHRGRRVAADLRNRIGGIEFETGEGFRRLGLGRSQRAIAVQVERRPAGSFERPFLFVAPHASVQVPSVRALRLAAATHHEDSDGRAMVYAVLRALEPAVVPAQAELESIDRCVWTEIDFAML